MLALTVPLGSVGVISGITAFLIIVLLPSAFLYFVLLGFGNVLRFVIANGLKVSDNIEKFPVKYTFLITAFIGFIYGTVCFLLCYYHLEVSADISLCFSLVSLLAYTLIYFYFIDIHLIYTLQKFENKMNDILNYSINLKK